MIAALVLLLVAVPADDTVEAKRLFRAGAAAYEAGRYLAAAQALEQSYQLVPHAATAFSLAQAYRLQYFVGNDVRHLDRAIALYRIYLQSDPIGRRRADAAASIADLEPIALRASRIEEAKSPLAKVDPATAYVPPTQLMVISAVDGATAVVDNASSGPVPFVLEVEPGLHFARVSAAGYAPKEERITAIEGRLVVLEVDLAELPAELTMKGEGGASVWIEDRFAGLLPFERPLSLSSGKHRVTVTKPGRNPWARAIKLERGAKVNIDVELEETLQRTVSIYVMAAGAVTAGGAATLGILALLDDQRATLLLDKRELEGLTPDERTEYEALAVRRNGRTTTSLALFGVAAMVGATGGLLFYLDRPGPVRAFDEPWLAIGATGDGLVVGYGGRF